MQKNITFGFDVALYHVDMLNITYQMYKNVSWV